MKKGNFIIPVLLALGSVPLFMVSLMNTKNMVRTSAQQQFIFEAEDGVISGVNSSVTPDEDEFINVAEATGTRETSGGKCVEYMGYKGNEIRWGFITDQATTNSGLSLYICCCRKGSYITKDNLGIYLNGTELTWNDTYIPEFKGNPNWYTWEEISADGLNFVEGENTITLINKTGIDINFDNGVLYLGDSVNIELDNTVIDNSPIDYDGTGGGGGSGDNTGTTHQFKFEAEKGKVAGTNSAGFDTFIQSVEATGTIPTSGDKAVTNWAYIGNTITWKINSNLATKNSGLSVYVANSTTSDITLENNLTFSVNGVNVTWNDTIITKASNNESIYTWREISADGYSLKEGENVLSLNNLGGVDISVDKIIVYVSDITELSLLPDSAKPTITNYEIKTEEVKTNNQVVISFEASDDVTKLEDLDVSVRVFLNFGEANQVKMTVKPVTDGYAFTPTEKGTYTIVIKVEDGDGQAETLTKTLDVTAEGSVSSGAGLQVNVKQTVVTTSIIILCVGAAAIAGLITYIVLKRKKLNALDASGGKDNE